MRSFTSPDLIQLPRMSGGEAVRLITELLTVAEKHGPLPGPIERSRDRLATALEALKEAIASLPTSGNPGFRRVAEQALDAAWEATFDWLSGWCKLAEEAHPNRAAARELFVTLFAGARAFGALPYKIQWTESRARLRAIKRDGQEATFEALGGGAFLEHLRASQRLCERAASVDATLDAASEGASGAEGGGAAGGGDPGGPEEEPPADIRIELADAAAALRQYVLRLVSHADPDVTGSEVTSEALMRPLVAWHQKHPSRGPAMEIGTVEETRY